MYTDEQKRRHIYDLQVCLRRIQHENDHPQPLVPDGHLRAQRPPKRSVRIRDRTVFRSPGRLTARPGTASLTHTSS